MATTHDDEVKEARVLDLSSRLIRSLADRTVPPPDIGVHDGLPEAQYHAMWPAASVSRLLTLRRSPAHMIAAMMEVEKETEALRLGRAIHMAALEPERFATTYRIIGRCAATKKGDGMRCSHDGSYYDELADNWYCGTHVSPGVKSAAPSKFEIIAAEDHARCLAITKALYAHPSAGYLLRASTQREITMVWKDEITGMTCKARKDGIAPEARCIFDIKSTTDASPDAFERQAYSLGYHNKAAWYVGGAGVLNLEVDHFVLIAVEKDAPNGIGCFRIANRAIGLGALENAQLLGRFQQCLAADDWPSYPDIVTDVDVPEWAYRY